MSATNDNRRNSILEDSRSSLNRYGSLCESDEYEELLKGGVPCPTCMGRGNIPKEQEGELIALIPVKDKRLRPRRTWLKVGAAVVLCLIIAGLLFFFLSQRDVTIDSDIEILLANNLTIDMKKQYVYFDVKYDFNITNDNYFPITLTLASTSVEFNVKVINSTEIPFNLNVPMRSQKTFQVTIGITFDKDNGLGEMAERCSMSSPFFTQSVMVFQTTATYNSLAHREQSTVTMYPLVDCGNNTQVNRLFSPWFSVV